MQSAVIGRSDQPSHWTAPIDLLDQIGDSVIGNGLSRKHAEVTARPDGTVTITDLDSPNGTSVDGVDLKPHVAVELTDGQRISLGNVVIVFRNI
jgi:pSer/pThr/pTyr-binding forkhead associated (FHA) protein